MRWPASAGATPTDTPNSSSVTGVGMKAQRRAAHERVNSYHQARLGELIEQVGQAVDRYRHGELDAFEVDEVIHHYHRAARQLWVFCTQSGVQVELTADLIERLAADDKRIDWWQRGETPIH